ncbi:MAG: hypothetical protein R3C12_01555 [Planctomycetaceae bacterium]
MSWRNIQLIFRREVGDQLRDRRTLFMVVVLPLLLYPALGVGMLQMSLLFSEQARTVVILGADDLPDPALLNSSRNAIRERWFANPVDAATLRIVSDHRPTPPGENDASEEEEADSRATVASNRGRASNCSCPRHVKYASVWFRIGSPQAAGTARMARRIVSAERVDRLP